MNESKSGRCQHVQPAAFRITRILTDHAQKLPGHGGEEQENLDVYFDLLPHTILCYHHVPTFLLRAVGRRQQQQEEAQAAVLL